MGFLLRILFKLCQLCILLVLPFILLVRLSVYFYYETSISPWACIGIASLVVGLVLLIYVSIISTRITGRLGKWRAFKGRAYFVMFLVWAFCAYGLLYLSGDNVKSPELRAEYADLHPIMRLATATILLVDRDMIITDASRTPADYDRMGIPRHASSLHFTQKSGYVHALDLRTTGRNESRNLLLERVYGLLGFQTLRHVGTADHLHIALKPR